MPKTVLGDACCATACASAGSSRLCVFHEVHCNAFACFSSCHAVVNLNDVAANACRRIYPLYVSRRDPALV